MKQHAKFNTAGAESAEPTPATTRILTAAVPADKSSVTLMMLPESGAFGQIKLTPNGLLGLIQTLGRIHAAMSEGKNTPPLVGPVKDAALNTRWHIEPALMGEATGFSFYHPGFGPVSFVVPIDQVRAMLDVLQRHVVAADTTKQAPRN